MLILWTPDENKDLFRLKKDAPEDLKIVRHSDTSALPPTTQGDVVLAMGGEVRDTLETLKLIPKKRTIGALRPPKSIKLPSGATLLVTYSMAVSAVNYELGVQARIDFNQAVRLATTGSLAPKLGQYRWVSHFEEAIEGIQAKYAKTGKPVDVALDLETIGLSPYAEKVWILTVQVAWKKGHADIVYIPSLEYQDKLKSGTSLNPLRIQLKWLLTSEMVSLRGANLKFDLNWIWVHYGIECTNFKFDTMIVGSLLDENRGASLNLHTKWYCPDLGGYDDHLNAKYDKSRMDLIPKDELLPYAAGDADASLRVADAMKQELLQDPALSRFYVKILHPAARAYEHVERTGLLIDVPYYLEFENELETEIERLEKEAFKVMGGRICAKHKDKLSLTRPAVLKEFMFGPLGLNLKPKMVTDKTGEPSTSMDHLMMFANDPAAKHFIDIVNEWAVARKMLSTYVCKRDEDGNVIGGFLSHMQPDCRFHPTYFLFNGEEGDGGTNTGRLSARDPAIQTVPKHSKWAKKLRKAYIAPPGMLILSNDYSQGELKITACLADEDTMIDAYLKGIDLHAITAGSIVGMELDEIMALKESNPDKYDELRQLGKAGNFGLIYGMGAEGFQNYAQFSYRVHLSLEQAHDARDKFFKTYSKLPAWHTKYKNLARQQGFIRSPLGRVRHLPLIRSNNREAAAKDERRAVNAPVQSTLSDLSLWSTALFHKYGWTNEGPVVAMVHDQLLSYIPEDNWEEHAKKRKAVMEGLPLHEVGWYPPLKFSVDCEVGPNLGELKKQKHI